MPMASPPERCVSYGRGGAGNLKLRSLVRSSWQPTPTPPNILAHEPTHQSLHSVPTLHHLSARPPHHPAEPAPTPTSPAPMDPGAGLRRRSSIWSRASRASSQQTNGSRRSVWSLFRRKGRGGTEVEVERERERGSLSEESRGEETSGDADADASAAASEKVVGVGGGGGE